MVERMGYKIYGTPWTSNKNYGAFVPAEGEELSTYWNKIPDEVDILLTHMPPLGKPDILAVSDGYRDHGQAWEDYTR